MDNLQFKFIRFYDPEVVAAGIQTGGSLLATGIGYLMGDSTARTQYKYQKKLIDAQNEYNRPKNQLGRLSEAGINPVYALGGGSITAGNQDQQGQAPDVASARQGAARNLQDAMKSGMDVYLQSKQIQKENELKDSQVKVNEAQALSLRSNAAKQDQETRSLQIRNQTLEKFLNNEIDLQDLEKELKTQGISVSKEQVLNLQKERNYLDKQIDIAGEVFRKSKAEADITEIEAFYTPERIQKEFSEIDSRIRLNNTEAAKVAQVMKNLAIDGDIAKAKKDMMEIELQYYDRICSANATTAEANAQTAEDQAAITADEKQMTQWEKEIAEASKDGRKILAPFGAFTSTAGQLFGGVAHRWRKF